METTDRTLTRLNHRHDEVRQAARLICLIRLLLLAMAVGVFAIVGVYRDSSYFGLGADWVLALLVAVMATALLLVVAVPWVVTRRQLMIHLVFDLCWCGGAIYLSGGLLGPGAPLIFAVVLTATLALPRTLPFVMPTVGATILAVVALLYAVDLVPFPAVFVDDNPRLFEPSALAGTYLVQVLALFVVDALGQALAVRLLEQRLLVGDLLDQIGDGVVAIDGRGAAIHVNDEARSLLGLADRPLGMPLMDLREDPGTRPLADLLAGTSTAVTVRQGPGGRWLRVRVGDLHGRRGRCIGRVMTLADQSDLRRAEENARRYEHLAELGEMAAGIAHEIRNPLASLRGCAQELAEVHREEHLEDAASLSAIIVSESDRLARIIEDFLRLSRQDDPRIRPVDLRKLLPGICDLLQHRDDLPPGLDCRCEVEEGCPLVAADPDHLRQVLLNLAGNAIDALRGVALPTLSVQAAPAEARVEGRPAVALHVVDNGSGVDPAIAADLFTPFVSGRPQGTGLGLSLVQRLVRSNRGEIEVTSGPEGGAAFVVLLPVWQGETPLT